jgi:hypothetical protein
MDSSTKLIRRIENILHWMDNEDINLAFWDELRFLLEDLKEKLD